MVKDQILGQLDVERSQVLVWWIRYASPSEDHGIRLIILCSLIGRIRHESPLGWKRNAWRFNEKPKHVVR